VVNRAYFIERKEITYYYTRYIEIHFFQFACPVMLRKEYVQFGNTPRSKRACHT
jgi:hypothetical protein